MSGKFLVSAFVFVVCLNVANAWDAQERFVEMSLDHFNPQNRETWMMVNIEKKYFISIKTLINPQLQRYFSNEVHYEEGGAIFIHVGGDFEAGTFWLENGLVHDIARDLNGVIIGTELRFFGENRPTNDLSTTNLRFLSTDQALADIAHLIDHVKREDSRLTNAKVILFGSMFGGNLATWFRIKYPQHSDGLWSSSSFVEARMNFMQFYEAVGEDIRSFGSVDCYRRISRAFRTIQNLVDGGRDELLNDMFHLCHPLDLSSELELEQFYESLAESVSYGIINGPYSHTHDLCVEMMNPNVTNDLLAFSEWFRNEHRSTGCFEMTFEELVSYLSEDTWDAFGVISGRRQYQYLTCTEYGWFRTTDSDFQPFGNRIKMNYFTELCRQVFGDWITEELIRENVERTNISFGGSRPNLRNAYFTNGGLDPNRFVNVMADIGDSVEARTLPRKLYLIKYIK